jgi:hypothetical protein
MAAFFGAIAVGWAGRLFTSPGALLASPASHFAWIAPEFAGARSRFDEIKPAAKPTLPMPGPVHPCGVWDRELDGTPAVGDDPLVSRGGGRDERNG